MKIVQQLTLHFFFGNFRKSVLKLYVTENSSAVHCLYQVGIPLSQVGQVEYRIV